MRGKIVGFGGLILALLASAFVSSVRAQEMPEWVRVHMERMVNGGQWLADNSQYRSADEPFDTYGTEWHWGIGRQSLTGRLFGVRDGKEQATFWEFRMFWHPGEGRLHLQQFGANGTFGTGTVEQTAENESRAIQWFHGPDGARWGVGHDTRETALTHETVSYDIDADGKWTKRRSYLWHATRQE